MDFIIRVLVCLCLGILIGIERQLRRRIVGLRTNVLVAVGSCLFVSAAFIQSNGETMRMAAQVVSGIGFLGAGIIIKDGSNVKGLNTAATLWCSAAVGILCGANLLLEAIIGTLFILFINIILRFFAVRMAKMRRKTENLYNFILKVKCLPKKETKIREIIINLTEKYNMTINDLESSHNNEVCNITCNLSSNHNSIKEIELILGKLTVNENIKSVGWEIDHRKESEKIEELEES